MATLSIPNTFVSGTVLDATKYNANFTSVKNVVNGGLDRGNFAANADILVTKFAAGAEGQYLKSVSSVGAWSAAPTADPIPTGVITSWSTATAPSGWLLCDGASYDTTVKAALFAIIGYAYGGSGANFNVPDFRGRTVFGLGTHVDVDSYADTEGLAVGSRRPDISHNHPSGDSETGSGGGSNSILANSSGNTTVTFPFLTVNWIIKE